MKRVLLLAAALALLPLTASADEYSDTIALFQKSGQAGSFFKTAYGYAVFPTIGKGGLGVGAARGSGHVYVGGKYVGDTTMTQVSVGLQAGGQAFSQIIFFKDKHTFDEFAMGNFELDAQASAVAITASASAGAGTSGGARAGAGTGKTDSNAESAGYYKGLAIFYIVKGGAMYEAVVAGQKFSYKPVGK